MNLINKIQNFQTLELLNESNKITLKNMEIKYPLKGLFSFHGGAKEETVNSVTCPPKNPGSGDQKQHAEMKNPSSQRQNSQEE